MRFKFFGAAAIAAGILAGLAVSTTIAQARVNVTVNLSTQRMHVTSSSGSYTWKVSTGRGQFNTPRGTYRPTVMRRMHYSRKYYNSPMPYSIFFRGGYAIHGTGAVGRLGSPASHGCVRLATGNAAALYAMVKREGARITIVGSRDQYYANNRSAKKSYASVKKSRARYASTSRSSGKTVYVKRYKKGKAYYAKRYKNGKVHYVKRYKKGKTHYVKRSTKNRAIASSRSRSANPLAYAPLRKTRSTFDFFRNPNNIR